MHAHNIIVSRCVLFTHSLSLSHLLIILIYSFYCQAIPKNNGIKQKQWQQ
jgi:hypothetical protein